MAPTVFIVLACVLLPTASGLTHPLHILDANMSMKFLNEFGYMSDRVMKMEPGKEKSEKKEAAIMMYQEYNHLNATGKLDNKTMSMMEAPRCGNTDKPVVNQMLNTSRRKRYATNSKWEKRVITYKFTNYARCCLSSDQLEQEFQEAVNMWMAAVGPALSLIREVESTKLADIDIEFVYGNHQDNISFAEMNTIAHAFYPVQARGHGLRGDIHFNDEENWTSGPDADKKGQNFLHTACHELGHSLGLEHSMAFEAVMYARIQKYKPEFALHFDDVNGIQSLYLEDDASTITEDDLETAASANYQSFQPHAKVSPKYHKESRKLPLSKDQHEQTGTNSHTVVPGVVVVSNTDLGRGNLFGSNNPQLEMKNWETYCTGYLSSKLIHTDGGSFSCLQFLWNQFYYRKATGYKFVHINTVPNQAINLGLG